MADITAKMVNELRMKTNQGMMECKKALNECGGDIDKAIDYFRKKGVKTSISERATTEGRVTAKVSADNKTGAIVEIGCNTDFTAKSETLTKTLEDAATKLLANPEADLANDPQIKADLVSVSQQTGENVQIGRALTLKGDHVGSYVYSTGGKGKIGVLVALTGKADDDLIRNLSMHIAAARPLALSRDQVPAELVEKEKAIAVEQATSSGKPQAIAEKIAEGKLNSFFAERVLLDQDYINAEVYKGKVSEFIKSKGATLVKYVRVEVGQ